jgi:cobyrinic acid a,c-diamide synthase
MFLAVARDQAFGFLYQANMDLLRALGAELCFFSPLCDAALPKADGLYLPGGYPELHAGALAAAQRFRSGLARFATTRPVHGECGGHMVLGEGLEDAAGARHAMAGLLGHATSFARRKLHLGYREARLLADGPVGRAGTVLRGHEFHYATTLAAAGEALFTATDSYGVDLGAVGLRRGSVAGSFIHLIDRETD